MITSLVRTTDAVIEPVTLAEAQAWLRVDSADDSGELTTLITTARQFVENFTGRACCTQTLKIVASDFPVKTVGDWENVISLDRAPVKSVSSIKYYPESGGALATITSSDYHVLTGNEPALVVLADGADWPSLANRPDAVEIIFVAGETTAAAVPKPLRQCVLFMLAHLYENRGAVNIGNIVNEIPFALTHMLEAERIGGWIA